MLEGIARRESVRRSWGEMHSSAFAHRSFDAHESRPFAVGNVGGGGDVRLPRRPHDRAACAVLVDDHPTRGTGVGQHERRCCFEDQVGGGAEAEDRGA